MTDITEVNTKYNLSTLLGDVERVKHNPAAIVGSVLEYLSNVTDNKVDIVDPTNPFVMLLESSAVNTAACINESIYLLRKQYPILAQTEEDLYRHMSSKDYLDRFSTPSKATFNIVINYRSLMRNLIKVPNELYSQVTIPRNTTITVDDFVFSIQYPIHIRVYESGNIVVIYDTEITSPLQSLTTNIIQTSLVTTADGNKCLIFPVETYQFSIKTVSSAIDKSAPYSNLIPYDDKYYYCRIFYKRGNIKSPWVEIETTHTEQVYNPDKVTAILQVRDKELKVSIPQIYTDKDMISGNLRIDIYTTKGDLSLNLTDYTLTSFSTKLLAIDEVRDINEYTVAMTKVEHYVYCNENITGGYNGLTFEQLKQRVINNSLGDPNIPITSIQLEDSKLVEGFEITKNIDSLTNRIYVVSKDLPTPTNDKLITSANITIHSVLTDFNTLRNIEGCYNNDKRITISTDVIFKDNNGQISIIDRTKVKELKNLDPTQLVELVNSSVYYYTPFHYVLDNSLDSFSVRAYYLDNPLMYRVNFINQNTSMIATVNTSAYYIEKTETGYNIVLVTKSDDAYKSIPDTSLGVVLGFTPYGEKTPVYIRGHFAKTSTGTTTAGEKVFTFSIRSNFDIDNDDCIYIDNVKVDHDNEYSMRTLLNSEFTFYYCTNAIPVDIVPSVMDKEFPSWLYEGEGEWLPITQESIKVSFGDRLSTLWTQSKSVINNNGYERYDQDVPLTYTEDVYLIGEDGTIVIEDENGNYGYTLLHNKGDIVYDDSGNIVYKYRKGDYKLDENGNYIPLSDMYISRIVDILMIEGSYIFTTDLNYIKYRKELAETIVDWITIDLARVNDNLLEQTHMYYRPKRSLAEIQVSIGNDTYVTIPSEQSFDIYLYVDDSTYKDQILRSEMETKIVSKLNTLLNNTTICMSDIIAELKTLCGSGVRSISIKGLGGDNNYELLSMLEDTDRVCLKKRLVLQDDNTIVVTEDINFIYVKH